MVKHWSMNTKSLGHCAFESLLLELAVWFVKLRVAGYTMQYGVTLIKLFQFIILLINLNNQIDLIR